MIKDKDYSDDYHGLFDESRNWDFDIEEFLENSERQEEGWLEDELERVEEQIESRDEIHEKLIGDLEWKIEWYADRLKMLYKQGRGKRDNMRQRLKDRIQEFYGEIRDERRQLWRDRQQLEEERRMILRELDRVSSDYLLGDG